MSDLLTQRYAERLGALHGDDFEEEVCARLKSVDASFSRNPAAPGDGGLDGVSHNWTRGYCCYGLEHSAFRTKLQREKAIITKFSADLRRLLELKARRGGVLEDEPNTVLDAAAPKGRKIKHIQLITNWNDTNAVLGPLLTKFEEYKAVSQHRFVDPDCMLAIEGPKELASNYAVDEVAIIRIQTRGFVKRWEAATAAVTSVAEEPSFDEKMDKAKGWAGPVLSQRIDSLALRLREYWRGALAFEHELNQTLPDEHRTYQRARGRIATRVEAALISTERPWEKLGDYAGIAVQEIERDFRTQFQSIVDDVGPGEIARLIGECKIDWAAPPPPKKDKADGGA